MSHSGYSTGGNDRPQHCYDEHYYEHSCGHPYNRTEPWLTFFGSIADKIIQGIHPHTVLDVGCAKGFLVEALRDRGVEAFGLDVSGYAIGQVREDIRPYCWVASAVDPFPRCYDLVVCLEVLEHLPRTDGELALENLCTHSGDILFSSTPDDHTEVTHLNVQPVEYWAELFAARGFYRDLDFAATFVATHAALFRKVTSSTSAVVRAYERKLWAQFQELQAHRILNSEMTATQQRLGLQLTEATHAKKQLEAEREERNGAIERLLHEVVHERERLEAHLAEALRAKRHLETESEKRERAIERLRISTEEKDKRIQCFEAELRELQSSLGFQLLCGFSRVKNRGLPSGSRRRASYELVVKSLKVGLDQGAAMLLQQAAVRLGRSLRSATRSRPSSTSAASRTKSARPWGNRVLLMSGSQGDMERYRCAHTQEQLQLQGIDCEVRHLAALTHSHNGFDYDFVILHRMPICGEAEELVQRAHDYRARVLFDIDDLVFDPEILGYIDALEYMDATQQLLFRHSVWSYRRMLELCDAALVTTDALVQAVGKAGKPAWVHRNALSLELIKISTEAYQTRQDTPGRVVIGYASGTRTHNRDFQEIQTTLQRILEIERQVEIWIIGYLDLDGTWDKWADRVQRIPFVPWRDLPKLLVQMDINLAPLESDNPFCEGKSELKYIEAAVVGVPTIASKTGAFEFAIRDGENGLLAQHPEDWYSALTQLITNPTVRREMGARARAEVLQRYHPTTRGTELLVTLDEIVGKLRGVSRGNGSQPESREADYLTRRRPRHEYKNISVFPEHELAHTLLDGLAGLEIGPGAHNPFGLRTRNVALPEGYEVYDDHQRIDMGMEPAPIDIWASADNIPLPDASEDFILTSHLVEHLPDVIGAFLEWDRIVKDRGYVLMIVPLKGALPGDATRELTTLAHFVEDYHRGMTLTRPLARWVWQLVYRFDGQLLRGMDAGISDPWTSRRYRFLRSHVFYGRLGLARLLRRLLPWDTHRIEGVPGGRAGHYHTFTPDSLLEVIEWMCHQRLCAWELVAREDIDSKVGNGFTLAFRIRHQPSCADAAKKL